jgi:hypothetical protein
MLSDVGAHQRFDYQKMAAEYSLTPERWDEFVREVLVDAWLGAYRAVTAWASQVLEITQGELVFLFDAAPTLNRDEDVDGVDGDDRVVAVWGRSRPALSRRDRSRLAGFLPNPLSWSQVDFDRGHLVAHAAGGALDLNLFPQAASLNRGRSAEGRVWRRMENYAARHPGNRSSSGLFTPGRLGSQPRSTTGCSSATPCGASDSSTRSNAAASRAHSSQRSAPSCSTFVTGV